MAPLRCLYVDLDNTLLGHGASLFHDAEGNVSLLGPRAIEACHRNGTEIVIMSGRRQAQVREDSRLFGARAYIFESGACWVDDGEETWLTAPYDPKPGATVFEQIQSTGAPQALLDRYEGELEYHDPWHRNRDVSHLFRGSVDAGEATEQVAEHELRLIDNGMIHPPRDGWRAFHLVPRDVSKGRAVALHARARGYARDEVIAVGDSREDLTSAEVVGTFWFVANALTRDPELEQALTANTRVAEAANGAGVYEAVVTELAERR